MSTTNISRLPRISTSNIRSTTQLHLKGGVTDYRGTIEDIKTYTSGLDSPPKYWSGTTDGSGTITGLVNLPTNNPEGYLIFLDSVDIPPTDYSVDVSNGEVTFTNIPVLGTSYRIRSLIPTKRPAVAVEQASLSEGDDTITLGTINYDPNTTNSVAIIRNGSLLYTTFSTEPTGTQIILDVPAFDDEDIYVLAGTLANI